MLAVPTTSQSRALHDALEARRDFATDSIPLEEDSLVNGEKRTDVRSLAESTS